MELQTNPSSLLSHRPSARPPTRRWIKEWVPQDVILAGGKCSLFRWVREDMLEALKEKSKEAEAEEQKLEPTTEVLFLCSFEGCGKFFIDAGALKKHAHVHGERQHVCQYEGCGKKFLDSSKLRRHILTHTGEKVHACPFEGCGKAFSLDFNLKAHYKTHFLENYHVCPYPECGKKYTNDSKLKSHIKAHHEKNAVMDAAKHTPPVTKHTPPVTKHALPLTKHTPPAPKQQATPKATPVTHNAASAERPFACHYEGCGKAYIHMYKLKLHLKKEHPGHNLEENPKSVDHALEETSDHDMYISKGGVSKNLKRSKPNHTSKMPAAKVANHKVSNLAPPIMNSVKNQWPSKEMYNNEGEDDSEETEEEDRDDMEEDGWRYQQVNGDDEETEDED